MTYQQPRAQIGGEVGVNGEFYEGGKFLPSTEKGKGKTVKLQGKVEIAPYVWILKTDVPEGFEVIYKNAHLSAMDWKHYQSTGKAKLYAAQTVDDEVQALCFCEQYAKGYRFYQYTPQGWVWSK